MDSLGVLGGTWRRTARTRLATPAFLILSLACAGAAQAAITASQITSPSGTTYYFTDNGSPSTFTVAGTTTGGSDGDAVDILCFYGDGGKYYTVTTDVPVAFPSATFDATGLSLSELNTPCVLRAVPAGSTTNSPVFSGPAVTVSGIETITPASGPNASVPYNFEVIGAGFDGFDVLASSGGCFNPQLGSYLLDDAFGPTTQVFGCMAGLPGSSGSIVAGRSSVLIDGENAYTPAAAEALWGRSSGDNGSQDLPGLPALSVTASQSPSTGEITVRDSEPLVKCTVQSPTFPPASSTDCPAFTPTGVTLNRTITQSTGDHVVSITDTLSGDSLSHQLDLLYLTFPVLNADDLPDFSQTGVELPGQTAYTTHAGGSAYTPPNGPGTIYIKNLDSADGDPYTGQGALTYSTAPSQIEFIPEIEPATDIFTMHYTPTLPASGSVTYHFVYSSDYTTAAVQGEALPAQDAFSTPTVAIVKPRNRSTSHTGKIVVSGRATDPVAIAGVKVDGRSVTLSSTGAFTTTISLRRGANTIKVLATNEAGNTASATARVNFRPRPQPRRHRARG